MSALTSPRETESGAGIETGTIPLSVAAQAGTAKGLRQALLALVAATAWGLAAFLTWALPDVGDWGRATEFALGSGVIGGALLLLGLLFIFSPRVVSGADRFLPWSLVLGLFFAAWEWLTAKSGVLPMPFFPPPQALLEVFLDEGGKLLESVLASLELLSFGIFFGALTGFALGVGLGCWKAVGYWFHPVLRLIGPLPPVAWLPIAFYVFPSSHSASIFLIALAVGFPVTILTWSGVRGVDPTYYDVARTMGASRWFLIVKVAIPAALPHVFIGLFMGLGASFVVLVTAEMMGVKAGLGFYMQWAQGWAAYANMYACLLVMALMCSSLVTLLFKLRDRVLSYQKSSLQW
ncbi:ABC transporter permease [Beijerinckia indica]|uniref:Binding-protein-dependent transport systems inner membrane component n=1 Tax=Beijerinckia indica subsp. indica (strain ATCC 9039 / DSM 1715 / NCIMB 8712) TaxID=395963 RepID=B2IFB5_BEII9|nr:ABC transporter permease [Beijerinckia indica]ACB95680.1 binding-protein-dependent transport systems inner membrane component [Beijerinckia indica subsp. indica ATCC 9039]